MKRQIYYYIKFPEIDSCKYTQMMLEKDSEVDSVAESRTVVSKMDASIMGNPSYKPSEFGMGHSFTYIIKKQYYENVYKKIFII